MAIGLVGRKSGMTRLFTPEGESIPVTVVEVAPNRVVQVKNSERDGYCAVQVTTGERKASRLTRSEAGHFAKAGTEAGRGLWEFSSEKESDLVPGTQLDLSLFQVGQRVDVTGASKGKGFAGVIKRWNFRTQDATHGNSLSHRAPGSIGQNQTPGRVWKGKKMAGHMGAEQVTVLNLEVVRVDLEKNALLIRGAVPGAPGGNLIVRPSVKSK